MNDPVTLYDETTPAWFRSPIQVIETPFEKKRRIEQGFRDLELQRAQLKAYFDAKSEAIDDHELKLHAQIHEVNRELEEMGEEI